MSKSPQKAIDASKAASRVAMESAQAIASINQKTAQEFAELIQQRVSDLMKAHDPKQHLIMCMQKFCRMPQKK